MSAELVIRDLGLVRYDAMIHAIAECHRVDEAKDIRDQARALEVLASQAKNIEAERRCADIRVRAERRWGQMYSGQEKASGGQPYRSNSTTSRKPAPTLDDLGVSKSQAATWQKLAEASDKQFEKALNAAGAMGVPTTAGVLRNLGETVTEREPEKSDPKAAVALWVWGRVNQFTESIDGLTPKQCAQRCDEVMRGDLATNLPIVVQWLKQLAEEL